MKSFLYLCLITLIVTACARSRKDHNHAPTTKPVKKDSGQLSPAYTISERFLKVGMPIKTIMVRDTKGGFLFYHNGIIVAYMKKDSSVIIFDNAVTIKLLIEDNIRMYNRQQHFDSVFTKLQELINRYP